MERRYNDRNVDLSLLSQWVENFFKNKDFKTTIKKETKGYKIAVQPTYIHEVADRITVSISGTPNDFVLKFVVGARSSFFMKFGALTTFLGGGFAFLKGVKSQEAEERLERNFWTYVEEKISTLTNSAYRG